MKYLVAGVLGMAVFALLVYGGGAPVWAGWVASFFTGFAVASVWDN